MRVWPLSVAITGELELVGTLRSLDLVWRQACVTDWETQGDGERDVIDAHRGMEKGKMRPAGVVHASSLT